MIDDTKAMVNAIKHQTQNLVSTGNNNPEDIFDQVYSNTRQPNDVEPHIFKQQVAIHVADELNTINAQRSSMTKNDIQIGDSGRYSTIYQPRIVYDDKIYNMTYTSSKNVDYEGVPKKVTSPAVQQIEDIIGKKFSYTSMDKYTISDIQITKIKQILDDNVSKGTVSFNVRPRPTKIIPEELMVYHGDFSEDDIYSP